MKKKKVDLLVELQVCFESWRTSKEKPSSKTPHAGRYGVTVLGFDADEYLDSGSCTPFNVLYDFRKKQFLTLAHGDGKTIWIEIGVTHWMPLPSGPIRKLGEMKNIKDLGDSIQRPDRIFKIFEKQEIK